MATPYRPQLVVGQGLSGQAQGSVTTADDLYTESHPLQCYPACQAAR